MYNEFSSLIKKLREKNGYTQTELSEMLGMKTYTTITKWENGSNFPKGRDIKKLAELFNVSSDYLLGLTDKITSDISVTSSELHDDRKRNVLSFTKNQLVEQKTDKKQDKLIYLYIDELLEKRSAWQGEEISDHDHEVIREGIKKFLDENPDRLPKELQ